MCWNSLSFKFKRIRNGNQKYLKKVTRYAAATSLHSKKA